MPPKDLRPSDLSMNHRLRSTSFILGAFLLAAAGCTKTQPIKREDAVASVMRSVSDVRFEDATQAAGLDFVQHFGGCGEHYFIEQVASGATVIDANNDGNMDIYFPAPTALGPCKIPADAKQRLYLNDGKAHFTLAENAFGSSKTDYGLAASTGDYNNDGFADIYVASYGKNTLYKNNGNGTFTDVTKAAGVAAGGMCTGSVWFDADQDGDLDLYVLRYCNWSVKNDIKCPGGACGPTTYGAARNTFYRNNGNGTFTDFTKQTKLATEMRRSLGVAAFDSDGDAKTDLFVANDLGPNSLFKTLGGLKFEELGMMQGIAYGITGATQANMGVAVGDYDEDGDMDVTITTFQNEPNTLYRNDGGFFTDVSGETGMAAATLPYLAFGTSFLDVNNSGWLDIFFADGHVSPMTKTFDGKPNSKQHNQLLLNEGGKRFSDASKALPDSNVKVHRGTVVADFDNDGLEDILVTATNDKPTLLLNKSKTGNWIAIDLKPANGSATPIGAKVVAHIGKRTLTRQVIGGGSYAGDSSKRLHFGIGTASRVDAIDVIWPSGNIETFSDITTNQVNIIKERR